MERICAEMEKKTDAKKNKIKFKYVDDMCAACNCNAATIPSAPSDQAECAAKRDK